MSLINYFRSGGAYTKSPYSKDSFQIYITGGENNEDLVNTAEVLSEDGWSTAIPSLPVVIESHCMVLINDSAVMVIAGYQDRTYYSPRTYILNTEEGRWRRGPGLKN